jgi:hypothetical protein
LEDSAASKVGNRKKDETSGTDLLDAMGMGTSNLGFTDGFLNNLFGAGFGMARQPWWKG